MPKNIVFTLFIVLYIGFVGALILSHYLTFTFPFSIQLINKPWSLPEEIVIGIMIAPVMLWSKVYHCHIRSDKIDTDCKIICYKDSQTIKSIIFPKEWREKNQEICENYYLSDVIENELKTIIKTKNIQKKLQKANMM
ncbi:hypothetical protein PQ692_14615 (plasmid) [Thermoanaerobacterium thermosaccharolyticum]|uniref:hypothetical protein n=1 Tax=Thermoanaerobacterium thermosaccharolyticum TaxID=1517 RepID=UPI003D2CD93E